MHKIILWIFEQIKNIVNFISIVCSFLTTVISLNWIETIIQAHWTFLDFLRPIMNVVLDFSNTILPLSFNAFGTTFDIKYITAVFLLLITTFICRKILNFLLDLEVDYHNLHIKVKKHNEKNFNKHLTCKIEEREVKINKYMVLINTQWNKNHFKKESDSMGEQNNLMNNFIFGETGVKYSIFNNGFLYKFDNFKNIDNTIDILFKLINSDAPLDYAISVQIGENLPSIKKLSDLKAFNKIIMSAETLYRYNLNKEKKYNTENVGVFQQNDKTLEVHEFKEKL